MSVTVSLAPYLLLRAIFTAGVVIASTATNNIYANNNGINEISNYTNANNTFVSEQYLENLFKEEHVTNFVDRDTLVKTLKEHGCTIEKEMIGYIKCSIENLSLEFYKDKQEDTEPYRLKIECNNMDEAHELMNEINNEYTSNVQEASYNKIKQRLAEKNMQIEEEEVYDDDTIVITVNLD